jgi:hypothetical protein
MRLFSAPERLTKSNNMPATMHALNLNELLKDIPRGAWVAISREREKVIAWGADIQAVLQEAKTKGEQDPIMTRVPESASFLMM